MDSAKDTGSDCILKALYTYALEYEEGLLNITCFSGNYLCSTGYGVNLDFLSILNWLITNIGPFKKKYFTTCCGMPRKAY